MNLIQRRSDTIHEGVPELLSSRDSLACPAASSSRDGRRRHFLPLLDSMWASTDALDTRSFLPSLYESNLSRPDEAVCLVSACPHVLLHLDYRYPFVAILVALGRDAFGCVYHGSSNLPVRHRASTPHGTVSLFVCTTIEPPDVDW